MFPSLLLCVATAFAFTYAVNVPRSTPTDRSSQESYGIETAANLSLSSLGQESLLNSSVGTVQLPYTQTHEGLKITYSRFSSLSQVYIPQAQVCLFRVQNWAYWRAIATAAHYYFFLEQFPLDKTFEQNRLIIQRDQVVHPQFGSQATLTYEAVAWILEDLVTIASSYKDQNWMPGINIRIDPVDYDIRFSLKGTFLSTVTHPASAVDGLSVSKDKR